MEKELLHNMKTFFKNEEKINGEYQEEIEELINFTIQENENCKNILKAKSSTYEFSFLYNDCVYPFSVFSNRKLQEYDIKTLLNKEERENQSYTRTLKLVCSMDLIKPEFILAKSNYDEMVWLFSFYEQGEEKIVDYIKNLIMNKREYLELFEVHIFNTVDKYELYRIYKFIEDYDCYDWKLSFLFFSKEMLTDLGRNFNYLTTKYDKNGMNKSNYILFSDNLYFSEFEQQNEPFKNTRTILDHFTLNPEEEHENIDYNEKNKYYLYFDEEFGGFIFDLLSNMLDEKERTILLSKNRYYECHFNAARVMKKLGYQVFSHIVSGLVKINERDSFYHSWVEVKFNNKILVLDYNHNLVMERATYYRLYGIKVISKMSYYELKENWDYLTRIWDCYFPCQFNYLGNELARDLKRNSHLFRK